MKKLLLCLFMGVMMLGLTGCWNDSVEKAEQDLQEAQQEYGTVEKETVDVLVAKFNTEVMDNSSLNPASTDYLTIDSNRYWYGLITGVYLVVVPEEYRNDPTAETVDYMFMFIEKDSEYQDDAIEYVRYLIKVNNNDITDNEIDTLLEEAIEKSPSEETANNGKGISIGYIENDDNYQYQVIRLYE